LTGHMDRDGRTVAGWASTRPKSEDLVISDRLPGEGEGLGQERLTHGGLGSARWTNTLDILKVSSM